VGKLQLVASRITERAFRPLPLLTLKAKRHYNSDVRPVIAPIEHKILARITFHRNISNDILRRTASKAVPLLRDWLCAKRDVEMEVERYRARSKGGSLMPLAYALCALQEINQQEAPNPDEARSAVTSALELVEWELGEEGLTSEAGTAINRRLKQMRADIGRGRDTNIPG
jgi:hypothetical protein